MKNYSSLRPSLLVFVIAACQSHAAILLNSWETGTEGWTKPAGGAQIVSTSTAFSSHGSQSLRVTNLPFPYIVLAQHTFATPYLQPWNTLGNIAVDVNFNWANRPSPIGNTYAGFSISIYSDAGVKFNLGELPLTGGSQTYQSSVGVVTNIPLDTPWTRMSFNLQLVVPFTISARGTPTISMDNLRSTPVPEPTTLLLLAAPLFTAAFQRKRVSAGCPPENYVLLCK